MKETAGYAESRALEWVEPDPEPRGIALITHGLNLSPERMRGIQELLSSCGIVSALYPLPGHRGSWLKLSRLGVPDIQQAVATAALEVERVRRQRSLGIAYLVAHSLGALAFLSALTDGRPFDRALLLAPALGLRRRSELLRPVAGRLPPATPVPSLSSRRDSYYPFLPLGSYRLLYELLDTFRDGAVSRPWELPSRIYIDPADEFLSLTRTRSLLDRGKLPQAELVVAPNGEPREGPAHLLIDRKSMGETLWQDLAAQLRW